MEKAKYEARVHLRPETNLTASEYKEVNDGIERLTRDSTHIGFSSNEFTRDGDKFSERVIYSMLFDGTVARYFEQRRNPLGDGVCTVLHVALYSQNKPVDELANEMLALHQNLQKGID